MWKCGEWNNFGPAGGMRFQGTSERWVWVDGHYYHSQTSFCFNLWEPMRNLKCKCEHQNLGYANYCGPWTFHKLCLEPFQHRRKVIGMLVSRLRNNSSPAPGPASLEQRDEKADPCLPPLCSFFSYEVSVINLKTFLRSPHVPPTLAGIPGFQRGCRIVWAPFALLSTCNQPT